MKQLRLLLYIIGVVLGWSESMCNTVHPLTWITSPPNSTSYKTVPVLLSLYHSLIFPFLIFPGSLYCIFNLYILRLPCQFEPAVIWNIWHLRIAKPPPGPIFIFWSFLAILILFSSLNICNRRIAKGPARTNLSLNTLKQYSKIYVYWQVFSIDALFGSATCFWFSIKSLFRNTTNRSHKVCLKMILDDYSLDCTMLK